MGLGAAWQRQQQQRRPCRHQQHVGDLAASVPFTARLAPPKISSYQFRAFEHMHPGFRTTPGVLLPTADSNEYFCHFFSTCTVCESRLFFAPGKNKNGVKAVSRFVTPLYIGQSTSMQLWCGELCNGRKNGFLASALSFFSSSSFVSPRWTIPARPSPSHRPHRAPTMWTRGAPTR